MMDITQGIKAHENGNQHPGRSLRTRKRVEEGRATSISGYFADFARRDMSLPTVEEIFAEWDAEDGIVRTKDETREAEAWAETALTRADVFYRNRRAAE